MGFGAASRSGDHPDRLADTIEPSPPSSDASSRSSIQSLVSFVSGGDDARYASRVNPHPASTTPILRRGRIENRKSLTRLTFG